MSKPKYLKLLVIVEEDYKPISGEITVENGTWNCENVMAIKLKDDFTVIDDAEFWPDVGEFLELVLALAKERSDE